jgi:acyl-homoserine-lactone acylase
MKILLYTILLLVAISCTQHTSETSKITENEILWDSWGIPHIYATNENNLYYSFGWAQTHSHGNLLLKLYGQARGKASEYWGIDHYDTDLLVQQLNLPQMAEISLHNRSVEEISIFQSFADGINAYVQTHAESVSDELKVVLPIEPYDIIAHCYRVFYLEFLVKYAYLGSQSWNPGSNAWAIGPSKSQSGNALLLANPHLPWFDFWMFYETHLNLDNLNLYGATLVGLPFLGIGFNDYLGWTHTVNTIDNVDVYELKIDNDKYLLDGQYIDIGKQSRFLKIKEDSVNYRIDSLVIKTTQHGIIIKEEGNKALAIRFSRMENPPSILKQWYEMGISTSYEDFENALKLNEIPLFNVVYADKEGNILYHFGGHVPKKSSGDWNHWRGIVSGDESQNIWTAYHQYEELPKVKNPDNGWVQNANDPPFTCTIPTILNPKDFPSYLAPNFMSFRPQQSANLLLGDSDISFEELIEYKHSTKVGLAERILDDLLTLKRSTEDSITMAAFEVLESWDKSLNAESRGAILFMKWIEIFGENRFYTIFETPWSFDNPNTTPDGIKDKTKALKALTDAANSLIGTYGTTDLSYGEVYRLKLGKFEYPANGGYGHLGLFRTVEFGEGVKAKVLLSYGNASQPGSKHIGDQLSLFAEKKLRDALRYRNDVEMNLEFKETIMIK